MLGLVTNFALVQQRRNPARISPRNLRLVQGEGFTLNCTIWNLDTDAAPANVAGAVPVFSIFRDRLGTSSMHGNWFGDCWDCGDYGWGYDQCSVPDLLINGFIDGDGSAGQMTFSFPSAQTAPLGGRYRFYIYDFASATVLAIGILQVDGAKYASPGLLSISSTSPIIAPLGEFVQGVNAL